MATKQIGLQELLLSHGEDYRKHHRLSVAQQKAMQAIERCGTSQMGYHTYYCDECGYEEISYNSCRNRHCPRCQWFKQQVWIDQVKSQLLPVRYFHLVFTLPEALNGLVLINHRQMYDLLFEASWHAIKQTASNASFLGAQTGALAVLHTWGQTLSLHPHLHVLVPGGGLDADGWQWIESSRKFFVPVRALSKIFRARYVGQLFKAIEEEQVQIPDKTDKKALCQELKTILYKTDWVVYCKKCFAGASQVISYLGRYTHRVAISESRIVEVKDTSITFKWKDYRDHYRWKLMSLSTDEFIRRFMLHILPERYYKIHYFGIFAAVNRAGKLMQCLRLLGCTPMQPLLKGLGAELVLLFLTGRSTKLCPICHKGRMRAMAPPGHLF
jgi:hypothetical protein